MNSPATRVMRLTVSGNRKDIMSHTTNVLRTLLKITDDQGTFLLDEDSGYEPLPGSIIMTEGAHGTAWQRWFGDGLWHRCGSSQKKDWAYLLTKRNVVLVYDADERKAS